MDNPDNQLNQTQQQSLNDTLERAGAFEELVRTKGWEFIRAYYENKVRSFTTEMLTQDKPITEFEVERNELLGLRKLISSIESDLQALADFRKKNGQ